MANKSKDILTVVSVSIVSIIANAGIFLVSYNILATPFLVEEQRVANAHLILTAVAGAYIFVGIATGLMIYALIRRRRLNRQLA